MNPQKVDAIGLLAVVALLAASYFGLFRGTFRQRSELERQAEQLKDRSAECERLERDLADAQRALQPLRDRAERALASLVPLGGVDRFLSQLATSARSADVKIRMLRPAQPQQSKGQRFLPIRVVAFASFPQLHQFLCGLERIDQLATLEELSVTSDLERRDCEASMTLHLHLPSSEKPL